MLANWTQFFKENEMMGYKKTRRVRGAAAKRKRGQAGITQTWLEIAARIAVHNWFTKQERAS